MGKEKTELEKIQDVSKESQACGDFLEWLCSSKGYVIARQITYEEEEEDDLEEDELTPVHLNMEGMLAEFYKIDLVQAEKERCELLERIRQ